MCMLVQLQLSPWILFYPHNKVAVDDHISQLGGVSNLLDRLRALLDTLEDWRSKLKGHEPPHVLPNDVEATAKFVSE